MAESENTCDKCWGRNSAKMTKVRKEFLEAQNKTGVVGEGEASSASSSEPENGWGS